MRGRSHRFYQCILGTICLLILSGCSKYLYFPPDQETIHPNQAAAEYNLQLGVAYLEQREIQRSHEKLLLALKQAPHWGPALQGMGYYLEMTGESEKAADFYRRALAMTPKAGNANSNYGAFLCRHGQYQGGITYFLKAAQDPDYLNMGKAYENAGYCALKIPDKHLAQHYFKLAHQHDPARFPEEAS